MERRIFLSRSTKLLLAAGLCPTIVSENLMSESNQRRSLSFSNDWIESSLVWSAQELPVEDAIVVNLSAQPLSYRAGADRWTLASWRSSFLRQSTIERAETVALLHVRQRSNLGGVALGWDWYGRRHPGFPRGTPLYISTQDEIGDVELDPLTAFTADTSARSSPRPYRLKLNLWYTPEETDCGIHTGHQFLEVHTQLLGTGHMQKFRENNADTLYENVTMSPGFTHDPFFTVDNDRSFRYPWHRYYADSDCVWMAVELHPI